MPTAPRTVSAALVLPYSFRFVYLKACCTSLFGFSIDRCKFNISKSKLYLFLIWPVLVSVFFQSFLLSLLVVLLSSFCLYIQSVAKTLLILLSDTSWFCLLYLYSVLLQFTPSLFLTWSFTTALPPNSASMWSPLWSI